LENFLAVGGDAGREQDPLVAELAVRPHPQGLQKSVRHKMFGARATSFSRRPPSGPGRLGSGPRVLAEGRRALAFFGNAFVRPAEHGAEPVDRIWSRLAAQRRERTRRWLAAFHLLPVIVLPRRTREVGVALFERPIGEAVEVVAVHWRPPDKLLQLAERVSFDRPKRLFE
jgi:hypothetical protein